MLGETQLLLTLTGVALYLFHHRRHLPRLIWRSYVLLLSGIGTVLLLKDTSKVLCFLAWLLFVCLHYFKELQKGNESECCICLEDLKASCPYECTRCKKATHAKCVVDYLEQSGDRSFRCPFCRKDMKVNKEQLKMAIENFHRLLGNTEASEEQETEESTTSDARKKRDLELSWEDQVEDEITENPEPSLLPGQHEPRPVTRPSVVTATKTVTIVSLMVTFHGSYQLFRDSYRVLPADLKKFVKVFLEDSKMFIRGPVMMCAQKLYNGVTVAVMFLYNSVFNSSGRVKRLVYGALQKVMTLGTHIWNSPAMAMVRQGTMSAANYLIYTFPAHAFNFTMGAYGIGKELAHRIWHSRFMTELREDITVLSYFIFVTLPVFFKDVAVSVWYSRPMELARQRSVEGLLFTFNTFPKLVAHTFYMMFVGLGEAAIAIWYSQLACTTRNVCYKIAIKGMQCVEITADHTKQASVVAVKLLCSALEFLFFTLPTTVYYSPAASAFRDFVRVSSVFTYSNVVVPSAKLLCNIYWLTCTILYETVVFVYKVMMMVVLSLYKFLYWLFVIKVPEFLKMVFSSMRLLWSYTSFVLREWWTSLLNSWVGLAAANAAQSLKKATISGYGAILHLLSVARIAAVAGFNRSLYLSRATFQKMKELLLTCRVAMATAYANFMQSHFVQQVVIPSIVYAGVKSREIAQSMQHYLQVQGQKTKELMLDSFWAAYNYDYRGVLYMYTDALWDIMGRVLYRDPNAVKA
ncbi:PREDICTED: uncharacterized protein LOC109479844 [Branchiostoma belcheri]|uniref:Uncharacterized protein LOC109479844 n=1 Tax=Branchiostoma belcheri TaxID=7741 RepID=A0A6P4Z7N4_BRABE|nr:PREDICTED: uncharacterized protein LOC109479844 [Branchiostoma belcheri]